MPMCCACSTLATLPFADVARSCETRYSATCVFYFFVVDIVGVAGATAITSVDGGDGRCSSPSQIRVL